MEPKTCDTCGQPWHDLTDHEPHHVYTPEELLALGTEVHTFELDCSWCGAKCEVETSDLSLQVKVCPFCAYGHPEGTLDLQAPAGAS